MMVCGHPAGPHPGTTPRRRTLGTMVNKASPPCAEKWEEALKINTAIVERYGKNNPLQLFGPQFGNIYYRKGSAN
jgi:hypothetical protein